jgi:nitrous oxidase accessory protein
MNRPIALAAAVLAVALILLSARLPLWTMTMEAPQYPKGLHLIAYGSGMQGDLHELNIINHYVGMEPIEPRPPIETAAFPYGIGLLVALCLAAPLHRRLYRLALLATAATPVVILADLQWWLYRFGHSLDPKAPIRLEPFTPPVVGMATLGNFHTTSMVASGFIVLVAAAVVLAVGRRLSTNAAVRVGRPRTADLRAAVLGGVLALAAVSEAAAGQAAGLQARIDAAPPGSTVVDARGVHAGPLVIRGPLTVVGEGRPIIDGGGAGSVVTIEGRGVVFRGFVVRNSGRAVTEEAAGIAVTGDGHVIERNEVHDVYFGVRVDGGRGLLVQDNRIVPGEHHGARPGHGISLWHTQGSRLLRNEIAHARDGIYLSFTEDAVAAGNEITGCRYGLHSMYSQRAEMSGNRLVGNLLGAALMLSDRLVFRGNRIEQHREGAAAYGLLLKDIGQLVAEDNVFRSNRVAVYAEGVPSQPSAEARLQRNVIAGNEVGLALQSNAALTFTENRFADNLTDVRPLGRQLAPAIRWSVAGRGNSWSEYRGYDADGDGIGDLPHRVVSAVAGLVSEQPLALAFLHTPAHVAIEAAARMFPIFSQPPVLVDEHPIMSLR